MNDAKSTFLPNVVCRFHQPSSSELSERKSRIFKTRGRWCWPLRAIARSPPSGSLVLLRLLFLCVTALLRATWGVAMVYARVPYRY